MNHKTIVPAYFDYDFTDSEEEEEDEEEEYAVTLLSSSPPPSPSSQHNAIVTDVVTGIAAAKKHHDDKTPDHQDETSPVDQEQEKENIDKVAFGSTCVAADVGAIALEHEHKPDEDKMEESKLDEQDKTSPVDTMDNQKEETQGHHSTVPIASGTSSLPTEEVKEKVHGWFISFHNRTHERIQRDGEDGKSDIVHITLGTHEKLPEIVKDSKEWTDNEKANAELNAELDNGSKGCAANETTQAELNAEHDVSIPMVHECVTVSEDETDEIDKTSSGTIHEHVEKIEHPSSGVLFGASPGAGAVMLKKHHDEVNKAEDVEMDEQKLTSPIDTLGGHEEKTENSHQHIGVNAGGIALKKHHDEDNKTEDIESDEEDRTTHLNTCFINDSLLNISLPPLPPFPDDEDDHEQENEKNPTLNRPTVNRLPSLRRQKRFSSILYAPSQPQRTQSTHLPRLHLRPQGMPLLNSSLAAKHHDEDQKTEDAKELDTISPVDTVDNQEQENKKTHRHYFHRHSNHPHHPHLGAIADHVSSAVHAIATGIGIKRHHHKTLKTTLYDSPSSSAVTTSTSLITAVVAPEPPHFEIVLVNIKKAAEERHIYCEKKHLDDTLPYVALSYRWGELDEQIVPATKDYYARIVSFRLDDFFKLCEAMQHEPDLQHIEYVWVDAICVDQENMEKRKATIYRMNEIYIHAAAIIAVPDLHAHHISINTAANSVFMDTIQNYRRYLYYLLVGTPEAQQALVDMDHAWMDKLGMPKEDSDRRDLILSASATTTTTTTTTTTMTNHRSRGINSQSFTQQMMTLMTIPSGGVTASTVDTLKVKDNDHHDRALPSRMMMEFQRFEWQQQLNQRQTDICQSVQFLQSIMEDWSNRTWVISEYHIAKKRTGKLKFWYNQLSCPELYGQRFFEFKFKKAQKKRTTTGDHDINHGSSYLQPYPYTKQIIDLTSHFNASMDRRLSSRTVLEMMLQTKASKVEDRFHAIIPLAKKYKHYIKDRQSISNLGVSDMLSVRLKLMEWSDTKDRLVLLFSEQRLSPSASPFLPTYATHFKAVPPRLPKFLTGNASLCNFDVTTKKDAEEDDDEDDDSDDDDDDQDGNNNNTSGGDDDVRLVRTGMLNELWLRPRMYCERHVSPHAKSSVHNLWHELGIDLTKDRLDAVSIPLFIHHDETKDKSKNNSLWALDLQLLGSWEKNIWIMYPFDANVKETKMCSLKDKKKQLPEGFRVY